MEPVWHHSKNYRYEVTWSWGLWVGFVWLEKRKRDLSVRRRHKIGFVFCFLFLREQNMVALS